MCVHQYAAFPQCISEHREVIEVTAAILIPETTIIVCRWSIEIRCHIDTDSKAAYMLLYVITVIYIDIDNIYDVGRRVHM